MSDPLKRIRIAAWLNVFHSAILTAMLSLPLIIGKAFYRWYFTAFGLPDGYLKYADVFAESSFLNGVVLSWVGLYGLNLLAGIQLLKLKRWARSMVLGFSIFNIFYVPIGTFVGIYSFWVLRKEETMRLFGVGRAASCSSFN